MGNLKETVVQFCSHILESKIAALKEELNQIMDSASTESKSTAGDKHETGRAMIQLEQEKLGNQLKAAEEIKKEFDKINFKANGGNIKPGSLVYTSQRLFFISVSIGKIEISNKPVFVLSPQSPLGQAFIGKKQKDTVESNGVFYEIINVD